MFQPALLLVISTAMKTTYLGVIFFEGSDDLGFETSGDESEDETPQHVLAHIPQCNQEFIK